MWRKRLAAQKSAEFAWGFYPKATAEAIESLQATLNFRLHDDLKTLLLETDGLDTVFEDDETYTLIYPVAEIIERNLELRSDAFSCYMPFDSLLAFGDLANGDLLMYGKHSDGVVPPQIFLWDHETDGRPCEFENLEQMLTRFMEGDDD